MTRNQPLSWLLILTLAGLASCSKESSAKEAKKSAAAPLHTIQGKLSAVQEATSTGAALNAGGQSLYIREGVNRYRLFLKSPIEVIPDKEYLAEGVYAQKAFDEIGDPDKGAKGYPLASSCQRVIRMAWGSLSLDLADGHATVLRAVVSRHPARAVFLVTKLTPVEIKEAAKKEKELPEIKVPADKQRAQAIDGPAAQPAPIWEPTGGTANCKVIIDDKGKVAELESGTQLCEAFPWSQLSYKPPVQGGRPVRVKTEVEVRFEPRK
jgi:hypothetical protein